MSRFLRQKAERSSVGLCLDWKNEPSQLSAGHGEPDCRQLHRGQEPEALIAQLLRSL